MQNYYLELEYLHIFLLLITSKLATYTLSAIWLSQLPTLSRCRGGSLTSPMLITAFIYFDPKVAGVLVTRLDPKAGRAPKYNLI